MRTRYRLVRRDFLKGAAAGLVLTAVPGARVALAQSLDPFTFQTNWRAQGEHGGYYQAIASGIYKRYGIDCTIRVGGPNLSPAQMLLGGRADAIISEGFQAFHYVKEDLPFLCVAGICQKTPTIFMTHPGVGNDSFEALRGKPIMLGSGLGGGGPDKDNYWGLFRARFGYTDDQLRPYSGNIAPFLINKMAVMKGYLSTEPYAAKKAGVDPVILRWDALGLQNYSSTIDTSQKMVAEKPDVLQRFLNASIEGWMQYIKGDDIDGANDLIKRANIDMTDEQIAFARQAWLDDGMNLSGDALKLGIGAMTDSRWEHFYSVMADIGQYPSGFDYLKAYTLQFVNKRVGLS